MVIKNKQKQHPRKPTYHQVYYSSLTDTKQHRQTGADTEGEALQHYAQICTLAKQFKRHRLQRRPHTEHSTPELEEHHTTNSTKLLPLSYAEMTEIARRRVTNQLSNTVMYLDSATWLTCSTLTTALVDNTRYKYERNLHKE